MVLSKSRARPLRKSCLWSADSFRLTTLLMSSLIKKKKAKHSSSSLIHDDEESMTRRHDFETLLSVPLE